MKKIFESTATSLPIQEKFITFLNSNPSIEEILLHEDLCKILNPNVSGFRPLTLITTGTSYSKLGNLYDNKGWAIDNNTCIIRGSEEGIKNAELLRQSVLNKINESGIKIFIGTDLSEEELRKSGVKMSRAKKATYFYSNCNYIRIPGLTSNLIKNVA